MTLYHRAADMLERAASTLDEEMVRGCQQDIADMNALAAELRAAAELDELTRENERLGLYEQPSEPTVPKRDRKADRARFHDPAFNRWLDEGISDAGHTVWDQIESVIDAWHGWDNRQFYATSRADPPLEPTRIFSSCSALVAADAIAGALYDFLGHLTTRDETLCMGATQECSAVVPALQAWAKTRNLPLDEANVKGWRDSIAAPVPAQPSACMAPSSDMFAIVYEQANDDGLWFHAQTAPEAYLQQELRRLHAAIEAGPPAQPRQPLSEWIACDDGLPAHGQLVALYGPCEFSYHCQFYSDNAHVGDEWQQRGITHWHALADLPIERAITGEKP